MPENLLSVVLGLVEDRHIGPGCPEGWQHLFGRGWLAYVCPCGIEWAWSNQEAILRHQCPDWQQLSLL